LLVTRAHSLVTCAYSNMVSIVHVNMSINTPTRIRVT